MTLRTILRKNRKKLGLTQPDFCVLVNDEKPKRITINRTQLGKWERGETDCPATKFIKILTVMNRELTTIGETPITF